MSFTGPESFILTDEDFHKTHIFVMLKKQQIEILPKNKDDDQDTDPKNEQGNTPS